MANLGFNVAEVEVTENDYSPIPAGEYKAVITDSEAKVTKKGDGEYVNLTFQVIEGEHSGRLIWVMANIRNPNPTAQTIGRETIAKISKAAGVVSVEDSAQLHNIPMMIKVGLKNDEYNGGQKNVIKGYKPIAFQGGVAPHQPAAPAHQVQPVQSQSTGVPNQQQAPWA